MKKYLLTLLVITLLSTVLQAATPYDFDGDGKSDFGVYQTVYPNSPNDLNGFHYWYISKSSNNLFLLQQFGGNIVTNGIPTSYDTPRPADYDGDGRTDLAVQRKYENQLLTDFFILNSSDNTLRIETFGRKTDKSTIIGDYDGDGKADLCVYGKFVKGYGFYYKGSLNNPNGIQTSVFMGYREGLPYRGNFDGDNKLDFCVWINQAGQTPTFMLKRSLDGGIENVNWGLSTDTLSPGDYDGDGKTDFGVRRNMGTNYIWQILERDGGETGFIWGATNGVGLSETDFDGDGKTDVGVYYPDSGLFYIRKSTTGTPLGFYWAFGPTTSTPIYNVY
jgi:FG-GAP-like repeat